MRAEGCDLGRFFTSREAAADWLAAHPEGMVHTIEEDFQLEPGDDGQAEVDPLGKRGTVVMA